MVCSIVQISQQTPESSACAAQGCLLLLPPLAWGRRQSKASAWQEVKAELKREKVVIDLEDSDRLDQTGVSSRSLCCPPIYSSSLPSQEQDVWISFPFLIEVGFSFCLRKGKGKNLSHSPFPSPLPSLSFGVENSPFPSKSGVRWFTQPLPSREQFSEEKWQRLFPGRRNVVLTTFPPHSFPLRAFSSIW